LFFILEPLISSGEKDIEEGSVVFACHINIAKQSQQKAT